MGDVVDLQEHETHFTIACSNSVHVIPVSMMRKIASGEMKVSELEMHDDLVAAIFYDWLEFMEDEL